MSDVASLSLPMLCQTPDCTIFFKKRVILSPAFRPRALHPIADLLNTGGTECAKGPASRSFELKEKP